ncbi:MAG: MFS transporter [Lentisphaerae bacterium]|nr:MFS transporter [Lentisphaerota bacterium]
MIFKDPLNYEQRRKTQKNYFCFSTLNGISYMCLGETIIVLFSIKLHAPNAMVASLGAILYLAFFMLPIGKMVAARVGAARSQAVFWTLRNIVAIGVALSAVTAYCGYPVLAWAQILLGACLFYGLRAAGVVMSQPFIGDMATESERPQVVGSSNALFYAGCMASLLAIWGVLTVSESVWMIMAIIGFGACVGVTSTHFIRQMDESSAMIEAARRPVMPEIREALKLPRVRKLIWTMYTVYLAIILLAAPSMLCIKRGYSVNDKSALFFSLMQFTASAIFSYLSGRLAKRFGVRRCIFVSYGIMLIVPVLWLIAPGGLNYWFATLVFLLVGGGYIVGFNTMVTYYLQATPERLWVATSMLTSVVTSVGAGVSGMLLSWLIFLPIERVGGAWEPLSRYKVYFAVVLLLLAGLSFLVWRLPETGSKNEKKARRT